MYVTCQFLFCIVEINYVQNKYVNIVFHSNFQKKTIDLLQVVVNLTTIRLQPRRALGTDSHILIIEFLKLLLSVFMLSFIFMIVCGLWELKRYSWNIAQISVIHQNSFILDNWISKGKLDINNQIRFDMSMVAVSFIAGGNRRTRRKPSTCCK
jgi:hypothetical protein